MHDTQSKGNPGSTSEYASSDHVFLDLVAILQSDVVTITLGHLSFLNSRRNLEPIYTARNLRLL